MILCNSGNTEFNREDIENKEAFEHLVTMFNGDEEKALLKYVEMFESDTNAIENSSIIDGFTPETQDAVVQSLVFFAHKAINGDRDNLNAPISTKSDLKGYLYNTFGGFGKAKLQEGNKFLAMEYKKILDNYNDFWNILLDELDELGIEFSSNGKIVQATGGDFVRRNWNDGEFLSTSQKDSASTRIKRVLSIIPEVQYELDSDGVPVRDENGNKNIVKTKTYLNTRKFLSLNDAIQKIAQPLVNNVVNSGDRFNNMLSVLEEKASHDPQMKEIVSHLKRIDNPELKTDFVNVFHKASYQGSMVRLRTTTTKDGNTLSYFDVFDSNRSTQQEVIRRQWYENQKLLPITTTDEAGNVIIDRKEIKSIRDSYIEAMENTEDSESQLDIIQTTLSNLGIIVPHEALLEIQEDAKGALGRSSGTYDVHFLPDGGELDSNFLMGTLFDTFLSQKESDKYSKLATNNPVFGQTEDQYVRSLATLSSEYKNDLYAPGYTNGEGNRVYSINDHGTMTQIFSQLMGNPELANTNTGVYDSTSKVLSSLVDNTADIQSILDLSFLDSIKKFGRTGGQTYANMEIKDKHLLKLELLQSNTDRSKFLSPTLSDKSRDYIVTLPNIHDLFDGNSWLGKGFTIKNGELSFSKEFSHIDNTIFQMVKGEYQRILELQEWIKNNEDDVNHPLGNDYMREGQKFQIYDFLNPENTPELYVKSGHPNIEYELRELGTYEVAEILSNKFREYITVQVNAMKDVFIDEGILQSTDNLTNALMDKTYLDNLPVRGDANKITYATLDYVLSNLFFNSEVFKILPGDFALHLKGDREGTYKNLQKRLANHIAPYITGNWGASNQKNTANIVTIEDSDYKSPHFKEYQEKFGNVVADGYESIESTDAQEYVTMSEHMATQLAYSEVTQDLYDKVMENIEAAIEDPKNPNNYYELSDFLTEKEIRSLALHPHKMVVVAPKVHNNLGRSGTKTWLYRKTSSMPLLPEYTTNRDGSKSSSIDNLRLAMEREGIDRVAYGSADKTGQYNKVNVFDDSQGTFKNVDEIQDAFKSPGQEDSNGNVITENTTSVQSIDRQYMGLQFQTPVKGKGIKILSQMNKSLTTDSLDTTFEHKGEELSGREIEERKQELMSEIYELRKRELIESLMPEVPTVDVELDVEVNDTAPQPPLTRYDETLPISEQIDIEALREVLIEEAQSRDWSPSAIASLDLTEANNAFELPLSFNPASGSIESLLMSIVKKRVIDIEMYGKSYIQTSSAGYDNLQNSNVALMDDFDGDELRYYRTSDETQTDDVAEILIPWDFKDDNGNPIPMSEFTDENGNVKSELIDDEILEMISARLPNQGASSQLATKVVGFLPSSYYATMVVPAEIVAQMGSDFDVDKTYAYQTRYKSEDGKLKVQDNLSKVDSLLKEYKDIHWTVLTNNEHLSRVLTQLDLPYLGDEGEFFESTDGTYTNNNSDNLFPLSPHQQVVDHKNNHIGKDLVGVTSNFSTLADILQMYNLPLKKEVQTENGSESIGGKVTITNDTGTITLDQIGDHNGVESTMRNGDKVTLSQVIMMYQNAALDNAKELVLDKVNATNNTINHIMALVLLNNGESTTPLEAITTLFNQPSIREMDKVINSYGSITSEERPSGRIITSAIESLQEDIAKNLGTSVDKIRNALSSNEEGEYININLPKLRESYQYSQDSKESNLLREEFLINQFYALEIIRSLQPIVDEIAKLQSLFNYGDRNGGGPSVLHARDKTSKYYSFIQNGSTVFDNVQSVVDGTEWQSAVRNSFILADSMYYDIFEYGSRVFQHSYEQIESNLENPNADDRKATFNEFKKYVFSKLEIFGDNIIGERERLLFGNEDLPSLAQRVKKAKSTWGSDNFFLRRVTTEMGENANDPSTIGFNNDTVEGKMDEHRMLQAIEEMLNSKNVEKRSLIEDLIAYTYVVQGGTGGYDTFIRYIPIDYLNKNGFGSQVKNILSSKDLDPNEFYEQFIKHNPQKAPASLQIDGAKEHYTLSKLIDIYSENEIMTIGGEGQTRPKEYISLFDTSDYSWKLYKLSDTDVDYDRIETLGNNKIVEYGSPITMIPDNEIESSVSSDRSSAHSEQGFNKIHSVQDNLHEESINTRFSVSTALSFVEEYSDNPYYVELAKHLMKVDLSDVNVTIADMSDITGISTRDGNIKVQYGMSKSEFNENLLHEIIHQVIYDQQTNNREEYTKVYGRIETIRKEAEKRILSDISNTKGITKQKFDAILDSEKDISPDSLSKDQHRQLLRVYYAVSNNQEFITGAMTNSIVYRYLNDITIKDQSLYSRVIDSIMDVLVDIFNNLGVNINRNSALYATMENFTGVISTESESKGKKKKDKNKEDATPNVKIEQLVDKYDLSKDGLINLKQIVDNPESTKEQFDSVAKILKVENKDELYDDLQNLGDKNMFNTTSLNQTVGEFVRSLDSRQSKRFNQIRNRIKTDCN